MTGATEAPVLLVLNAGSSSVKFALFDALGSAEHPPVCCGTLAGLGNRGHSPTLRIRHSSAQQDEVSAVWIPADCEPLHFAIGHVLDQVAALSAGRPLAAVGHRVVHGGVRHDAPVVVDASLLTELETLSPLAPLHQPYNLAGIRAVAARWPQVMQVACFDTAFHRTCPELEQRFALNRALHDAGVRRYGFHGLSYEYVTESLRRQLDGALPERLIIAHLGAGSSLCALHHGRSIATTMGFSTLDGLMMGTRCGSIDPGVILHLLTARNMSVNEVSTLLYHDCGLLGVSGLSAEMAELLDSNEPAAKQAIDLYCYRARREIGSLVAALGGLDGLVFTAGIGEHASLVRASICERLDWLGLKLDDSANAANAPIISAPNSALPVWVTPTDEQAMIARHTLNCLATRQLSAPEPRSH